MPLLAHIVSDSLVYLEGYVELSGFGLIFLILPQK